MDGVASLADAASPARWAAWVAAMAALCLAAAWIARRRGRASQSAAPPSAASPSKALPSLGAAQRRVIEAGVPLYRRVPAGLRADLDTRIAAWIGRVEFVGCNGLEVSERMRLVIAAQACIPSLGLERTVFDRLYGVMLYPDEFWVEESEVDEETGVVTEGGRALAGQTVDTDRIVLSWRDVEDAADRDDGYNVVIHEVAHYLDHVGGGRASAQGGALAAEYAALCDAVDRGAETLIDPYGAEDPVEFLAVSAELFFERPRDLRREHPALYGALREAFRLDPAAWPHLGNAP
jgi:Mlc titration factor MtfA (ptsG expression regulator)